MASLSENGFLRPKVSPARLSPSQKNVHTGSIIPCLRHRACKQVRAMFSLFDFVFYLYTEYDMIKSCLIMLLLFLIDSELKRLPACNMGGSGWAKKRKCVKGVKTTKRVLKAGTDSKCYAQGELKVAFESDGKDSRLLASIVASSIDGQTQCRTEFEVATGEAVVGPMPPTFGDRKAAQNAVKKRKINP